MLGKDNLSFSDRISLKSYMVSVLGLFVGLIGLAFAFPGFVNEYYTLKKNPDISFTSFPFGKILLVALAILLILFFTLKLTFRPRKSDLLSLVTILEKTIRLCMVGIDECKYLIESKKLDEVISRHTKRIETYIADTQESVRVNIPVVIDNAFFEQASKAAKSNENFNPIVAKAYNELANLSKLENYIKQEHRDAQKEIRDALLNWVKSSQLSEYVKISKELNDRLNDFQKKHSKLFFWFNPKLKNIVSIDYEHEILLAISLVPVFSIIKAQAAATLATATVASLGGILASEFDIDDSTFSDLTGQMVSDNVQDEIGSHVASELINYMGASIPYIGFAFIILRIIRYMGWLFVDKEEELDKMRRNIAHDLATFLDSICNKGTQELEISAYKLVSILEENFQKTLVEANSKLHQLNRLL